MNEFDFPELYSSIILGTTPSPGQVTLSGHERKEAWDVKSAKGQDGATTSLNGKPIGRFKAKFSLLKDYGADDDQFARWDEFQRLIESTTNGPKPTALPIYHPDLARNGYTEVTNGGVGGLTHDGKGGATVEVEFLEYRPPKPKPPKKATSKPSQSTAGTAEPNKPNPYAAQEAELAGLLEEAQRP